MGEQGAARRVFPILPGDLRIDLDNTAGSNGGRVLASCVCFGLKHVAELAVCPLWWNSNPAAAASACAGGAEGDVGSGGRFLLRKDSDRGGGANCPEPNSAQCAWR